MEGFFLTFYKPQILLTDWPAQSQSGTAQRTIDQSFFPAEEPINWIQTKLAISANSPFPLMSLLRNLYPSRAAFQQGHRAAVRRKRQESSTPLTEKLACICLCNIWLKFMVSHVVLKGCLNVKRVTAWLSGISQEKVFKEKILRTQLNQ